MARNVQMRSVVMPIILVNVIAFLIQIATGMIQGWFTQAFILESSLVLMEPWRLVTSMFLHANGFHIFINMYILFSFGSLLESRIGPKRFLALYFISGIFASFIATFFYPSALGASGAIMGVIGAVIMLFPHIKVLFFFIIPMPLWVAGIVLAFVDMMYIIFDSTIGGAAHIAGMVCGLGYGFYLKRRKKNYSKRFKVKAHLDDEEIDAYLKDGKI